MFIVKFHNVGYMRQSWTAHFDREPTEGDLVASVRQHRAVLSALVEVAIEDQSGIVIVGGCRAVGTFEITEGARRVCSWCRADMGASATDEDSHGICPTCLSAVSGDHQKS